MKKMVIYITIFVSVILSQFIFINNVKAYDINNVNLTTINTLPNYRNYYSVSYNMNTNSLDLVFYNQSVGYISTADLSPAYINDICQNEGGCFSRFNSNNSSTSSPRLAGWYKSYDNGNTWTLQYQNVYSTNPISYSYIIKTTAILKGYNNPYHDTIFYNSDYEYNERIFQTDFIQGPVLMANYDGRTANLLSFYVRPLAEDLNINDYKYCYIESSGGFREGETCFELKYWESGEVVNGVRYYYYYNLPLFYNVEMTYNIYDLEDNLIQSDTINAYLDILTDLHDYYIYNFYNYEYANMSNINSGYFAISKDLIGNVDINVVNINNNTKQPFLTSSYYNSSDSYIDSNGYQWYNFNFNNENVYLEIINKVNDITDFWAYVDNYDLKLIFENNAYVHLSGNASSEENKDNPVNQQSYMDSNGNIHYVDNPVVSDFSDTTGFMSHIQKFFPNISNDTFGITSIVTSPLNLIKSMVSKTCSPLVLPIPYTNNNITLPCMTNIYQFYYPLLYEVYELILYGIISYHIIVDIYFTINKIRASHYMNEIEVVDL